VMVWTTGAVRQRAAATSITRLRRQKATSGRHDQLRFGRLASWLSVARPPAQSEYGLADNRPRCAGSATTSPHSAAIREGHHRRRIAAECRCAPSDRAGSAGLFRATIFQRARARQSRCESGNRRRWTSAIAAGSAPRTTARVCVRCPRPARSAAGTTPRDSDGLSAR